MKTGQIRTIVALSLIFVLTLTGTNCHSTELRINAFLEEDGEVYLGQQVRFIIEIETDTWFTSAPSYPELTISGAIVLKPDAFGVNSSRQEGSTTWSGQRQRFVIFPQRTGLLTIPPIEVTAAASSDGRPGNLTRLRTPELTVPVIAPPGMEEAHDFVTTSRYALRETWDRDFRGLRVGDALVRTVSQTADGTFALMLPTIQFAEPPGVAAYPAPPMLDDRANRGRYVASRTDAVTYVLQQPGELELPGMDLFWFDLNARTMRRESLAALVLEVAENPDLIDVPGIETSKAGAGQESQDLLQKLSVWLEATISWLESNLVTLTIAAALLWLLQSLWPGLALRLTAFWHRCRQALHSEERARYRKLIRAARRGDSDEFVGSFWSWSDRLPGRKPPLTATRLSRQMSSGDNSGDVDPWSVFESTRYGGTGHAAGADDVRLPPDAASRVQGLRRDWFRASATTRRREAGDLNP